MKRFFQALTCAFIICCSALFSGNFAYVSNSGDGTLTKINLTTNTAVGVPITGFTTPQGLAVSVDGRFVYVSDRSGFLHIVSTATDSIVKSIPLPTSGGFGPIDVAMSPDGTTAYVANEGTEDVHIINTSSQTLTSSIPNVGDAPFSLAISSDGRRLYVALINDGAVGVIDTATDTVIAQILSGGGGSDIFGVAVSPDNQTFYATSAGGDEISIFDASTLTLTSFFNLTNAPHGITTSLDGFLYVVEAGGVNTAHKISATTNAVLNSVAVGSIPYYISLSPNGLFLYVVNNVSGDVSVIDVNTFTVISTIGVGAAPWDIAMVFSPMNLKGMGKKDTFLTESDIFVELKWDAPQGFSPGFYEVYRNNERIATIPSGGKTSFKDHNLKRKQTYTYVIVADGSGGSGASDSVTVKTPS